MEVHIPINSAKDRIAAALNETIAALKTRVEKPYDFRFVSQQQVRPTDVTLFKWIKDGRKGPPPPVSIAGYRASIYDQARIASELAAFPKVVSISAAELGQVALDGLKVGQIVAPYTALRGFIERTAHTAAFAEDLKNLKSIPNRADAMPQLIELTEVITKALYSTQRDWPSLINIDFRSVSHKTVKYKKNEFAADMQPDNVLNSVDQLERRVAGTRLVYEVLCEFLHPNIGDLHGATLSGALFVDEHGTKHLTRKIGLGPKHYIGLPDQHLVAEKLLDICCDIVRHMPSALAEIESASLQASAITRKFAHKVINDNRDLFKRDDICPCLSGLSVKECRRLHRTSGGRIRLT